MICGRNDELQKQSSGDMHVSSFLPRNHWLISRISFLDSLNTSRLASYQAHSCSWIGCIDRCFNVLDQVRCIENYIEYAAHEVAVHGLFFEIAAGCLEKVGVMEEWQVLIWNAGGYDGR